ncbi:alpha/beta fold hydrolase [Streptomyces qinzhouensis]|uniref:Alpha/beta fold hydrolase n=1 Tax=Streptomyces qinzhouensis TaxID=2599401 RepID=A0A5B8IFB7_9ACTN|nr:alpha/beta fold hydrolase [Streptomyces qinzhouensis]QDY76822.1 alpha/beta fold hydrolase [Streptomyces qinzhouensis]
MKIRLPRPRTRGRWLAGATALVALVGGGTWAVAADDPGPAVHREDGMRPMPGAQIDTSYFVAGDREAPRPAVLLGHGFGGSKDDVRKQAERLARDGYAVLTWSARGFGKSTGRIGLNDPAHEVKDVSRLLDWLAARPEVRKDAKGDPRVGIAGASYGGAIALLAAGYDRRVDAIAPAVTYWNLADALFPGGVFKKLWAGMFFSTGSATAPGTAPVPDTEAPGRPPGQGGATGAGCGRFQPALCAMYERVAVAGKPDAEARQLLEARSPSAVGQRITVPTLVVQGQSDSLFPLGQADAMAQRIRANGAPVAVDWISGGHDGGDRESDRIEQRVTSWFDRYLKNDKGAGTGPAFRVSRTGGVDSTDGAARLRGATAKSYPGLGDGPRRIQLTGRPQSFGNPAGGSPPAISAVPGLSGGLGQFSSFGVGLGLDFPGQHARFESAPLDRDLRITGAPTVRLRVTSSTGEAVLFGKVYDVGPDGRSQVLPSQLVAPVRVEGAERGKEIQLTLPAVDHRVDAGHRLRLVLSATDLGYASPAAPADYTVALADSGTAGAGRDPAATGAGGGTAGKGTAAAGTLTVPTAPGIRTQAAGLPWWTWGLPAAAALIAAGLLLTARRRTTAPAPDPALAEVPLEITGLTKRYAGAADRYAVRELSFRVEKGQVLGLLGPNGAGKTTTLRMLMGLIRPDEGEIRVFGHAIRPGAPVLSRVGAFVEGAGFLPHLSGRENLELYWQATGRPAEDARLEEALEIADLGSALARAVRTYSQGMRQRLAIAQAMLGLPDLLILDEPTNGLDPPQIREMREVMIRYAAGGRTVIVSSHLLSEVEQSCTHLVVMDRGRLVQAGPVAEITGGSDTLLITTAAQLSDPVVEKIGALPGIGSARRVDEGLLVQLSGATSTELIAELVRLDVPLTGAGPYRRLEDAFLTLIGGSA